MWVVRRMFCGFHPHLRSEMWGTRMVAEPEADSDDGLVSLLR